MVDGCVDVDIASTQTAREFPLAYLTNEQKWIEADERKKLTYHKTLCCATTAAVAIAIVVALIIKAFAPIFLYTIEIK